MNAVTSSSMFSVPLNASYRIINAASSPALILVATTAPNVINLFRDTRWVFDCPVNFTDPSGLLAVICEADTFTCDENGCTIKAGGCYLD